MNNEFNLRIFMISLQCEAEMAMPIELQEQGEASLTSPATA
jgi:hypothetical protein